MSVAPAVSPTPRKNRKRRVLRLIAAFFAALTGLAAGGWLWFTHRPQPAPLNRAIFQGVAYRRDILRTPRPLIVHILTVDLNAPGIAFLVTPGDPGAKYPLHAQTTSQFRERFGAQVAVNGDYFFPYSSNTIFDYYPHVGDPVDVEGVAVSRGISYGEKNPVKQQFPTLYISRDNRAHFLVPPVSVYNNNPVYSPLREQQEPSPYNAISGIFMLLRGGRNVAPISVNDRPEPCTAVALDHDRTYLLLVMVDGRQPNYSEGMTLHEFADLVQHYGGYEALDLDGGGSEALVMQGADGKTRLLNAPIDGHIPGRERAVANHLGIFAAPLP